MTRPAFGALPAPSPPVLYDIDPSPLAFDDVDDQAGALSRYAQFLRRLSGPFGWLFTCRAYVPGQEEEPVMRQALEMAPLRSRRLLAFSGPSVHPDFPSLPVVARPLPPGDAAAFRTSLVVADEAKMRFPAMLTSPSSGDALSFSHCPGLPEQISAFCLRPLASLDVDCDLVVFLRPVPVAEAVRLVRRRRRDLAAALTARPETDRPDLPRGLGDARRLSEDLYAGREGLCHVSLLLAVHAAAGDMRGQVRRAHSAFAAFGLVFHPLRFAQERGLSAFFHLSAPPGTGTLLDGRSAARLMPLPWSAPTRSPHPVYGLHARTHAPVGLNRTRLANPSALVLGAPGSGKSAFAKAELRRLVAQEGLAGLIVDPEGEYTTLAADLGSSMVRLQETPPPGRREGDMACIPPGDLERLFPPEAAAESPAVLVNLEALPPRGLRAAAPFLFTWVWQVIEVRHRRGLRTVVLIDELHLFLREPAGGHLATMIKRARKWGALFTGVTQNVGDLLATRSGQALLANAGTLMLFRQSAHDLKSLGSLWPLPDSARQFMSAATPGQALLWHGGFTPVEVVLSSEELTFAASPVGWGPMA